MTLLKRMVRISPVVLMVWLLIGICGQLGARAGGAGGHSSSGGHSSGGGGFSSHGSGSWSGSSGSGGGSLHISPGIIILIIVVYVIFLIIKSRMTASSEEESFVTESPEYEVDSDSIQRFLTEHPDFDFSMFGNRVSHAFMKIQQAWSVQDISSVRQFISDGMYQRFTTQFRMMGLLKQSNRLDNVQINSVQPVSARTDGPYDVIDVRVAASMRDSFVCGLDHSLDEEGDDSFVEYWSFIRKRGASGKEGYDIFSSESCPSCGAVLDKNMGEICRCSHCQVLVNSGDFDWVLAEITQEDDYGSSSGMARHVSTEMSGALVGMASECTDFSVQMAEDKASNAFMQIMTATATRNPASIRRFVTDQMLATFTETLPERNVVFDRIYLNEAVLLNVWRQETQHMLQFGMSASMRRVELLPDGSVSSLDSDVVRTEYILAMERDADAVPEKGSLYQHQCPSCGGAIGDTIDVNCQYCGNPLNSTRGEWIVCSFGAPE